MLSIKWIADTDFYVLNVNRDSERRFWLSLFFDPTASPADDAAVMIGDVLHNLRSALDILWHDVIRECGGTPSRYSRFPIRNTADELKGPLNNLLEEQQIEPEVENLLLNSIKPYQAGELLPLGFGGLECSGQASTPYSNPEDHAHHRCQL